MGNTKPGILAAVTTKSSLLLTLKTEVNFISNHLKVRFKFNALAIVCGHTRLTKYEGRSKTFHKTLL